MRMLGEEPRAYQLTVHRDNYNYFYGEGSFERDYVLLKANGHKQHYQKQYAQMIGYINHYGVDAIGAFINDFILVKEPYEQVQHW